MDGSIILFPLYRRCESSFISNASCKSDAAGFSERRADHKRKEVSPLPTESRSRVDLASKRAPGRGMKGCTIQRQRKREYKSWGREEKKSEKKKGGGRENVDLDENNSSN